MVVLGELTEAELGGARGKPVGGGWQGKAGWTTGEEDEGRARRPGLGRSCSDGVDDICLARPRAKRSQPTLLERRSD